MKIPRWRDLVNTIADFEQLLELLGPEEADLGDDLPDLTQNERRKLTMDQIQAIRTGMDVEDTRQILYQFLENLTISELRDIGRRREFNLKGTRKADIIDQLMTALRNSTGEPDFMAGLDHDAYEMLRIINTIYGIREFLTWDAAQWAWHQHAELKGGPSVLEKTLGELQAYGLLYRCQLPSHSGDEQHYHWLPYLAEVRLPVVETPVQTYPERKARSLSTPEDTPSAPVALGSLVAFARQYLLRLREPRPRHQQSQYYPWLGDWDHDLDEIDQLAQRSYSSYYGAGVALTVPPFRPLLADEVLNRLAQWLGSQPEFASWLVQLAIAAEILTPPVDKKAPLNVQYDRWIEWCSLPPAAQLRTLFDVWRRGMEGFTELSLAQRRQPNLRLQRTLAFHQQFTPADLAREFALARGFATRLLQGLPVNTWYDWFSFAETARQTDPDFLHNYYGPDVWGFAVKDNERLDPAHRNDWDRGYRPVLAAFLEGPLRWLGVVDVGYKGQYLVAFRLTPTGAWLLRGEDRPPSLLPAEADEAPIAWLDEHMFRALPGPELGNILAVADGALATLTRRAFGYELTGEGVQRAFAHGFEPAAIAEVFEKAGAPLPETTRQHIEDLWSHFGQVHLYEKLTVLELADDLALRELSANINLRQHIVHQFSPRLVVVEDSAVDSLVEELIQKGYTPKVADKP